MHEAIKLPRHSGDRHRECRRRRSGCPPDLAPLVLPANRRRSDDLIGRVTLQRWRADPAGWRSRTAPVVGGPPWAELGRHGGRHRRRGRGRMNAGFAPLQAVLGVRRGRRSLPFYEARFELIIGIRAAGSAAGTAYSAPEPIDIRRCVACGYRAAGRAAVTRSLLRFASTTSTGPAIGSRRSTPQPTRTTFSRDVLRALDARITATASAGCSTSVARMPRRLMSLATRAAWDVEGIELNPRTCRPEAAIS